MIGFKRLILFSGILLLLSAGVLFLYCMNLSGHPTPYGSLLLSKKRIVDDLVVRSEAALRARELARGRGEAAGTAAGDEALSANVARIAKSGLHHAGLSEAALLALLESLTAQEAGR